MNEADKFKQVFQSCISLLFTLSNWLYSCSIVDASGKSSSFCREVITNLTSGGASLHTRETYKLAIYELSYG